ncbi:MAG: histidine kinase [Saprospiraceae bacterium]|nr:MAG: histidine kinase [Saprospiraceae bacterium]
MLGNGWDRSASFFQREASSSVAIGLLVYINLKWLLPKLYFQKKQGLFILVGLAIVIALTFLVFYLNKIGFFNAFDIPKRGPDINKDNLRRFSAMKWIGRFMPLLVSFIGSTLFEIAAYANKKETETVQLQKEKLETEVKFLKSQINPHFLFNALNNIYTLSVIKSDAAPENLLRLSDMLRYMLYDCEAEKVPLQREIDYIRNFVNLKLLKDSQGLNVEVDLDESRPNLMVAPMLFIPFIENAFKHSKIEDLQHGWIKIYLKTAADHILLEVQNSIPTNAFTKDKEGGIGLENVRRQLQLLYPEHHELEISTNDTTYLVSLKITFS